jgi:two-component system cell cycle sensor histidine kinase/response regulator CckA
MLFSVTNRPGAVATILVVEDEPQLLRLIVRVLERASFAVLSARDGDQATEIFTQHADEIDAVILDVIIPPGGAREVMDAIREKRPDLPLMLSSGDQLEPALEERLSESGGRFLRKPYVPKTLLHETQELLKQLGKPIDSGKSIE